MAREYFQDQLEDGLEMAEGLMEPLSLKPNHDNHLTAKYQLPDEKIAELRERYMPLTVAGAVDKQGYAVVRAARLEIKDIRIQVEKTRKGLKEDSLAYGKAVDTEAKRITALLQPIEDHLEAEEKRVDTEIEAVKAAKQKIIDERNQGRVDALLAVGATVGLAEIVLMTDENFNSYLDLATKSHLERERIAAEAAAAEAARIEAEAAEAARKAKEEADRLQAERDANAKAKAENDRIAAELKAQMDEINKQKADIARAAREKQIREEAEVFAKAKVEQEAKAEIIHQEVSAARAAAIDAAKPDAEKLKNLAGALRLISFPTLTTEAGRRIGLDGKGSLEHLAVWLETKAEDLTK